MFWWTSRMLVKTLIFQGKHRVNNKNADYKPQNSYQVSNRFTTENNITNLWPATEASPEVTSMSPVNILNVVVFPAPLTPRRPKHYKDQEIKHNKWTIKWPACFLCGVNCIGLNTTNLSRWDSNTDSVHCRDKCSWVCLARQDENKIRTKM